MEPMNPTTALFPRDITADALNARLCKGEPVQIVDVRSGGEFAGGRIAGAKLLPLPELAARQQELDRETPVVCVCQGGHRSACARDQLLQLGYTNVASMTGGMNAWTRAGFPVEKDAGAPWALERQVRMAAGSLVLLGVGLGWFVHPLFFGLSAFVGVGLVFAGVTDWCGMGLLLARAPWNRRA
jgi:rhodanese-related sulfurtransferase